MADRLPVAPGVVARIVQAAANPDSTVAEISRLISTDPTLTTEVLRAVNSAFFGLRRQVGSVDYAVTLMGIRAIRNLVLCFGIQQSVPNNSLEGFPLERFWECSLRRGAAASCLARRLGLPHADELLTVGLLQDAGVTVIAGRGPEVASRLAEAMSLPYAARIEVESTLGERHDVLGARLFAEWRLPSELTQVVRYHHHPADAPAELRWRCEVVRVAEAVADLSQVADKNAALRFANSEIESLGLNATALSEIVDEVAERVGEAADMLRLRVGEQPNYREVVAMASQALLTLNMSYEDQVRGLQEAVEAQLSLAAELERRNRELEQQATTDLLTGLPNRRMLESTLARELSQARRQNLPVTVVMLDVDHFKGFNDRWGHRAGDRVLEDLGQVLRAAVREADLSARFGGEEFTLVLPFTDRDGGWAVAERIRARVESMVVTWAGESLHVTISLGGATDDGQGTPGELIQRADEALYASKEAGRNCIRWAAVRPAEPAVAREMSSRAA